LLDLEEDIIDEIIQQTQHNTTINPTPFNALLEVDIFYFFILIIVNIIIFF